MRNSSGSLKHGCRFVCILGILVFIYACSSKRSSSDDGKTDSKKIVASLSVDTVDVLTENRLALTRDYAKENYGINDYRLLEPKMIVVHYTAIATLEKTLNYFKPDSLESSRTNIIKKSPLNVGVQYVIDKDGSIYHLLPDSVMGRHLIGFNHVALGIENVARNESDLTDEQIKSNADLIRFLSDKYSSIEYLIGHQEYSDASLPHYKLLKANDPNYMPYPKFDPGDEFLEKLRGKLKSDYGLEFEK